MQRDRKTVEYEVVKFNCTVFCLTVLWDSLCDNKYPSSKRFKKLTFDIFGCIPVAVKRIIICRGVVGHLPVENKFTIILSPNSFLPPLRP